MWTSPTHRTRCRSCTASEDLRHPHLCVPGVHTSLSTRCRSCTASEDLRRPHLCVPGVHTSLSTRCRSCTASEDPRHPHCCACLHTTTVVHSPIIMHPALELHPSWFICAVLPGIRLSKATPSHTIFIPWYFQGSASHELHRQGLLAACLGVQTRAHDRRGLHASAGEEAPAVQMYINAPLPYCHNSHWRHTLATRITNVKHRPPPPPCTAATASRGVLQPPTVPGHRQPVLAGRMAQPRQ